MATKTFYDNENITKLDELFFVATKKQGDDYKMPSEDLLLELEKRMVYKQFLRDVGEDFKIVVHNKDRDASKITDDMFEYVLCNGQQGLKEDYPEYCAKFGITSDIFNFPDLKDGYFVNNPVGSGTANGTYLLDSIKSHSHTIPNHTHGIADIKGIFGIGGADGDDSASGFSLGWANGAFTKVVDRVRRGFSRTNGSMQAGYYDFSSHRAGVTTTNNGGAGNTGETGEEQTAGRRTTVQIYIKAKFLGNAIRYNKKLGDVWLVEPK